MDIVAIANAPLLRMDGTYLIRVKCSSAQFRREAASSFVLSIAYPKVSMAVAG
jgi:hypothetical protein